MTSSPVDILYFIGNLDRGGAETHLLRIVPRLDRKKFHAKIFLLSAEGELADDFRKAGIELITPWVKSGNPSIFFRLFRIGLVGLQVLLYLLINRPKIVHFFLPGSYLLAGPLSFLARIPVKIMSRRSLNYYQRNYPGFVLKLEHWLHSKMQGILGNSQKVVDQLILEEGAKPERTSLLYNGIEMPKATERDIRSELNLDKDSQVVAIVANLIPYKGHEDLLNAFGKANITSKWDLLIVGNNSANIQDDLQAQADRLNIAGNIHFLGKRDDVSDILSGADVGLLTSHEEGFSNAILEGMAAGLPMIVTDVGGNAEAVEDGKTGYVVPTKNPEELAKSIKKISEDANIRQQFGQAGRKRCEEQFSLESCVTRYEEYYQNQL